MPISSGFGNLTSLGLRLFSICTINDWPSLEKLTSKLMLQMIYNSVILCFEDVRIILLIFLWEVLLVGWGADWGVKSWQIIVWSLYPRRQLRRLMYLPPSGNAQTVSPAIGWPFRDVTFHPRDIAFLFNLFSFVTSIAVFFHFLSVGWVSS